MATWIDPIDSQTDPDAPLTSDLGKRWDNNVVAAFEGASGAPRLARLARVDDDTGAAACDFSVPADYFGAIVDYKASATLDGGATTRQVQIAMSDDNGSSYETAFEINVTGSTSENGAVTLKFFLDFETGGISYSMEVYRTTGVSRTSGTGTVTVPAGTVDRVRVQMSAGTQGTLFAEMTGGTAAS